MREIHAGFFLVNLLVYPHDLLPIFPGHFGVELVAFSLLKLGKRMFEGFVFDIHHHGSKHFNQATVGVPREAGVACRFDHAFGNRISQPDVENRVHHPGHGELRAGAAGNQ